MKIIFMEKDHLKKKMDRLLKEEKEKLESEIRDKVEKKKAQIKKDDEEPYKKRRF
jgi:hypothetical protein